MITITRILDSAINGLRTLKVNVFGRNDPRYAGEAASWGVDSCPVKDTKAYRAQTLGNGNDVIVGYENKNQKAEPGEFRGYATDADGNFAFNFWMRADGSILIGDSDDPTAYTKHFVNYEDLNTAIQTGIVSFVNTQLGLIATGIAAGGGSYTPGTMNVNILAAKLDKIKTK